MLSIIDLVEPYLELFPYSGQWYVCYRFKNFNLIILSICTAYTK